MGRYISSIQYTNHSIFILLISNHIQLHLYRIQNTNLENLKTPIILKSLIGDKIPLVMLAISWE